MPDMTVMVPGVRDGGSCRWTAQPPRASALPRSTIFRPAREKLHSIGAEGAAVPAIVPLPDGKTMPSVSSGPSVNPFADAVAVGSATVGTGSSSSSRLAAAAAPPSASPAQLSAHRGAGSAPTDASVRGGKLVCAVV